MDSFFEKLFMLNGSSDPAFTVSLKKYKDQIDSEGEKVYKQAKEYTLNEAVGDFGLTYSSTKWSEYEEKHRWKIEELSEVKTFQASDGFRKVSL